MFTFAQYVFGVGRSLENSNNSNDNENNQTLENSTALSLQQQSNNNNNNCNNKQLENPSTTLSSTTSSSSSGCYENDSESNCSLTNIENDWILIDHAKAKNKNQEKKVKSKLPNITIASNSNNKNPTAIKTFKNNKNEKWLVDPPECFKPGKRKNHHEKQMANDNDDDDDEKTEEMENLLIEHPSMSVFDDLFVKKPNPITLATVQRPSCSIVNSATIKQSLSSMNKAEQRKIILARIQQSLKNNKENGGNNNNKKSKSNGTGSSSSSQTLNNVPLAQLNGNNNKALIATIIDSNDKNDYRKNKKQITKKQYQRQNKNIQQRNGPIIRQKKMFTHINGIYHNRNNC